MHRTVAVSVCLALLGMALLASAQNVQQPKPAQAEQFVTLSAIQCPPIITQAGAKATVKFKADRSLRDDKTRLLGLTFRVQQDSSTTQTAYYEKGEKPTSPPIHGTGTYTMSSDDQGILTVEIAPSIVDGTIFGLGEGFVLKGKRTLSVELVRFLDQRPPRWDSISNVLKCDVEFR